MNVMCHGRAIENSAVISSARLVHFVNCWNLRIRRYTKLKCSYFKNKNLHLINVLSSKQTVSIFLFPYFKQIRVFVS